MVEHSVSIAIIRLFAWMPPCDITCLAVMSHSVLLGTIYLYHAIFYFSY